MLASRTWHKRWNMYTSQLKPINSNADQKNVHILPTCRLTNLEHTKNRQNALHNSHGEAHMLLLITTVLAKNLSTGSFQLITRGHKPRIRHIKWSQWFSDIHKAKYIAQMIRKPTNYTLPDTLFFSLDLANTQSIFPYEWIEWIMTCR